MSPTIDERDARFDAPVVNPIHHEDVGPDGDVASVYRHRRERGDVSQSMMMTTKSFCVAESEPVDTTRGLVFGDCHVDALLRASQDGSSRVKLRRGDERAETPGDLGESRVIAPRDTRCDVDE